MNLFQWSELRKKCKLYVKIDIKPFFLDPLHHMRISSFRKLLVNVSEDLNRDSFIVKMKEFLVNTTDGEILHSLGNEDVCSMSIFQRMIQACLISEQNLSLLDEMMVFCSRKDLLQRIDDFRNKNNIFKKGAFVHTAEKRLRARQIMKI